MVDSVTERKQRRRWMLAWSFLLLISVSVRTGVVLARPVPPDGDHRLYLILAESMARGEGYVLEGGPKTTVHPLLPAMVASLTLLGLEPATAGTVLAVGIGSLLPLIGGFAVGSVLGRRYGMAAGLLLALLPHHVLRSGYVEPDLLAALLGFWAARLLWRREWLLAGAVVGLAYLNRPEMILLYPVASIVAWRGGDGFRGWIRLTVPVVALCSIFVLFVHGSTGRWALSGKDRWQYLLGVHQYRSGNRPMPPEAIESLRREIPTISGHITGSPGEFASGYGYRTGIYLLGLGRQLLFVLVPASLAGVAYLWRRARDGLLVLCLPMFLLPVYPVVGVFYRHTLVTGPILAALAGVGLLATWEHFARSSSPGE